MCGLEGVRGGGCATEFLAADTGAAEEKGLYPGAVGPGEGWCGEKWVSGTESQVGSVNFWG